MGSKTYISFLIGFFVFNMGCNYDPKNKGQVPGEVFDVGPVFASKMPLITHAFDIKNTSGRKIRILGESHSCTCTTVDVDRVSLEPGESIPLRISVRTPQGNAASEVSCVIKTDCIDMPEWTYRLKFESFQDCKITPDVLQFGGAEDELATENLLERAASLEIFATTDDSLPVPEKLLSATNGLAISLDKKLTVDRLPSGVFRVVYPLKISFNKKEVGTGTQSGEIVIKLTQGATASARVFWDFSGPLQIIPSHVNFGLIGHADTERSKELILRSIDKRPFRIIAADGGSQLVSMRSVENSLFPTISASSHRLTIVLAPPTGDLTRPVSGTARIKTDLSGLSDVLVAWTFFPR